MQDRGDDGDSLDQRLCRDQAIERIAVIASGAGRVDAMDLRVSFSFPDHALGQILPNTR